MNEAIDDRRTFESVFAAQVSDASAAALRASPVRPVPKISFR
jgi:hypothetical protein